MDHKPQKRTKRENGDSPSSGPPPSLVFHHRLPEDVLENIFSFLPIKEAVQVGTISTRYKKTWLSSRRLVFGPDISRRHTPHALAALVDKVFDSSKASKIQAFCLNIDPTGLQPQFEKWVQICILKQIEELEFQFLRHLFFPSRFLDIQTLRILKLVNCTIQLPSVLTGLKFLNTLVLRQLGLTENQLETFVSHCKLLETLDLSECYTIRVVNVRAREHNNFRTLKIACCPDVNGINIDVPSLRSVFFCGVVMMRIKFATLLPLKEAFVNILPSRGYLQSHLIEPLVFEFFHVTVLSTSSTFVEALGARIRNGEYREMLFCLPVLRELQVFMEGGSFCNPYDIAVFLKSCPCLEALFIDLNDYNYDCGLFWQIHHKPTLDSFPYNFTRLRFIKLIGFKFEQYQLQLVKVLLKKSINLEVLVFVTPRNNRIRFIYPPHAVYYRYLFQTWTASPRARIFLFEHYNDRSFMPSHRKYWY